jgi:hypothetical protein
MRRGAVDMLRRIARYMKFRRADRVRMTAALVRAGENGVTVKDLVKAARETRDAPSYGGYLEAQGSSKKDARSRKEKAVNRLRNFLYSSKDRKGLDDGVRFATGEEKIIPRTDLADPATLLFITSDFHKKVKISDPITTTRKGLLSLGFGLKEYALVYIDGVPCGLHTFHAFVRRGGRLHVVATRVSDRYEMPEKIGYAWVGSGKLPKALDYETWAKEAGDEKTRQLFSETTHTFAAGAGVWAPPLSLVGHLYSGWCWGACGGSLHRSFGASDLLILQVTRVAFRDHRAMTVEENKVIERFGADGTPTGLREASEWLVTEWRKKVGEQSDKWLPPHHMVRLSVLVEMERPVRRRKKAGDGAMNPEIKGPWVVLSHRFDVTRGEGDGQHLLAATATGHATSERVRDDPRGPDLELQVHRLVKRQIGVEVEKARIRWLGASVLPEEFAVTLHAVVDTTATADEVVDLFRRRTERQKVRQLAFVSRDRVLGWLKAGRNRPMAVNDPEGLLAGPDCGSKERRVPPELERVAPMLETTLALWAVQRGYAAVDRR